jgi:DNA repair protein RadA/Sms
MEKHPLLQISLKLPYKTLYVSGEESQTNKNEERITSTSDNCCHPYRNKTKTYSNKLKQLSPKLSSSIQYKTLHTEMNRLPEASLKLETTAELIKFAKETISQLFLLAILPRTQHSRSKNFNTC